MEKLSQEVNSLKEKVKGLSRNKKIAYGVITAGVLASIISGVIYFSKPKYAVLFSNMDQNDIGEIYNKLKEKKENFKVEGNNILVPKDKVDNLRMEVLSQVPIKNGVQGFELLDKSKFGTTDQEMKINYQRALQGEIERTIKSFQEVENVRVHLVMSKESAFIKETDPAKASITLKLKPYKKLTKDQVRSIVALVTGSVKNLPRENVEVNDTQKVLTKDLFEDDEFNSTDAIEKQQMLKKQYEKSLENKLSNMLETVYGKDKVKIKINADLNFDTNQTERTIYDPRNVVVSEKNIKNTTNDKNTGSGSPVDNAMGNRLEENNNGVVATHDENIKNYEISKTEDKLIKAPGSVNRVTASVVLDGNLDNANRTAVTNIVRSAIGYDERRGDRVTVEGIPFDTSYKDASRAALEDMNREISRNKKEKLITISGITGALILIAIMALIIGRKRRRKDEVKSEGLDVVIDDKVDETDVEFKPIELEEETEQEHIEKEIRKYAMEKPDQVVEVVKSWLAEDER